MLYKKGLTLSFASLVWLSKQNLVKDNKNAYIRSLFDKTIYLSTFASRQRYIMSDHYVIILFVTLFVFALDHFGLWKGWILTIWGKNPLTHVFWAPFIIINLLFFSLGLFLTNFDLKSVRDHVTTKVIWSLNANVEASMVSNKHLWFDIQNLLVLLIFKVGKEQGNPIARYKIQPGTNAPLTRKRFNELLRLVSFNQIIVGGITQYIFYILHVRLNSITANTIEVMPSVLRVLFELAIFILIEESLFFYFHWALHRFFCHRNPFLSFFMIRKLFFTKQRIILDLK